MSYFKGNNQQKAQMQDPASYTAPKLSKGMPVDMYLFVNEHRQVPQGRYNMKDLIWAEVSGGILKACCLSACAASSRSCCARDSTLKSMTFVIILTSRRAYLWLSLLQCATNLLILLYPQ